MPETKSTAATTGINPGERTTALTLPATACAWCSHMWAIKMATRVGMRMGGEKRTRRIRVTGSMDDRWTNGFHAEIDPQRRALAAVLTGRVRHIPGSDEANRHPSAGEPLEGLMVHRGRGA